MGRTPSKESYQNDQMDSRFLNLILNWNRLQDLIHETYNDQGDLLLVYVLLDVYEETHVVVLALLKNIFSS